MGGGDCGCVGQAACCGGGGGAPIGGVIGGVVTGGVVTGGGGPLAAEGRGRPQLMQNCDSSALVVAQFGQVIGKRYFPFIDRRTCLATAAFISYRTELRAFSIRFTTEPSVASARASSPPMTACRVASVAS